MLDQATAGRLVKLLGMTGSAFDGEAIVAMRKANELLQTTGLTWSDVIAVESEPEPDTWQEPENWREAVCMCLSLTDAPLSDWDRGFLSSISRRAFLSERQRIQLDRIVETCRVHARMAA